MAVNLNTVHTSITVLPTRSKMSSTTDTIIVTAAEIRAAKPLSACPDCGDTGPTSLGMDHCLPCWEKRRRCDHACRSCNIKIAPEKDICNGCAEQYLGERFCNGCETMYRLEAGEEDTGNCPSCTCPDPSTADRHCSNCDLIYRLEKDLGTCPKCNYFGHKLVCKMCNFNHLRDNVKERESGICKKCQ